MRIKWLGHSCFLITSKKGVKIITDPYKAGLFRGLSYRRIDESADIITVSHQHYDHNNSAIIKGNPEVLDKSGEFEVKGIEIEGISSFHDDHGGTKRGQNIIFCFTVDGIRLCHLGDLGHELSQEQISRIGEPDIVMVPVGGRFTIGPEGADKVIESLKPIIVIPMHFRTGKCLLPLAKIDSFLADKPNVKRVDSVEIDYERDTIPPLAEVIVLKHAL
ncbi:MAG: MBL fold metallo-hydrolase [Chloroflexota bacterium]|nr:MBL fold metallo-hydrolase [Chloroflexota bacterium]